MFKKAPWWLVSAFTFLFSTSFTTTDAPPSKPVIKTIIIDAGHGLPDPGALGASSSEAAVTLAVALKLGKMLEEALPNCRIVYTRTGPGLPGGLKNKNDANRLRAKMANDAHGDLFISIHCNSTGSGYKSKVVGHKTQTYYVTQGKGKKAKKVKKTRKVPVIKKYKVAGTTEGTETYVWAAGKNDLKKQFVGTQEEDEEGEKEQADTSYKYFDSPEAKIMASLRTRKYFDNSCLIASFIEEEFVKAGRPSRGVKQRDWEAIWVLQATAMPSILTELGFISTPDEEEYMNSAKGQEEISTCIKKAVLRYKTHLEK
jgi:N-acetylmuramoyl-L-alanine amidase